MNLLKVPPYPLGPRESVPGRDHMTHIHTWSIKHLVIICGSMCKTVPFETSLTKTKKN